MKVEHTMTPEEEANWNPRPMRAHNPGDCRCGHSHIGHNKGCVVNHGKNGGKYPCQYCSCDAYRVLWRLG